MKQINFSTIQSIYPATITKHSVKYFVLGIFALFFPSVKALFPESLNCFTESFLIVIGLIYSMSVKNFTLLFPGDNK